MGMKPVGCVLPKRSPSMALAPAHRRQQGGLRGAVIAAASYTGVFRVPHPRGRRREASTLSAGSSIRMPGPFVLVRHEQCDFLTSSTGRERPDDCGELINDPTFIAYASVSGVVPVLQPKQPASPEPVWANEVRRLAGVLADLGLQEIGRRRCRMRLSGPQPAVWAGDSITIPNHWKGAVSDARYDPEGYVVRARTREIGWQLYALGGLIAMRECLTLIERSDVHSYVDAAWSGVGVPASIGVRAWLWETVA